jgi:hypothetical protein
VVKQIAFDVEEEANRIMHERALGMEFARSFMTLTFTHQGVPKEVQAITMARRERAALFRQMLMRSIDLGIPGWFEPHGVTTLIIRRQLLAAANELKLVYLRTHYISRDGC